MKKLLMIFLVVTFLIFGYFYFFKKSIFLHPPVSLTGLQDKIINLSKKEEFKPVVLEIISPKDGEVFFKSPITVKGKTVSGGEVFVNEKEVRADEEGNFFVEYPLDEGENEIIVVVNDQLGNYQEKVITVELKSQKD